MAHTPGPWKVIIEHDVINDVPKQWPCAINAEDDELVLGYGEFYQDNETQFANAQLMAASPDLLDACKVAYADMNKLERIYRTDEYNAALDQLRAAIAKAEPTP